MAFFSPSSFSSINQPKMRQEGFHLPSPSPSIGNPPSPSSGPFDLFLSHSSHHAQSAHPSGSGSGLPANNNGNGGSAFPSLALPDAFSRTHTMDLTDELAMSLMASSSSPATSNERSTHTPPFGDAGSPHDYRPNSTHNIFDISAPPSTHFSHLGGHAFSLPHTSHRPDLPPLSQAASLATSHLHGFDHHHHHHHQQQQQQHQQQQNQNQNQLAFLGGRDPFPSHFNSTIPPLSAHHEQAFGPFTPTSTSSGPPRDTPSPGAPNGNGNSNNGGGTKRRADSRPATGHSGRSPSRSRSRVRTGNGPAPPSAGGGPTRTTKSTSRRRDSFTMPHLSHSHSHSHSSHLHTLPSPPLGNGNRPQAIVIPSHGGPGGALSPLGSMGGLGNALSPLGVGQASGWFLPGPGGNPGSAPAGSEFQLPTPESMHGAGVFGQFGTSVGSMGISPKDTTLSAKDDSPPIDAASKQAAIVNEKRRRRRESHNAVERRRRDNINEKISELATLIPEVMLDPSAPTSSSPGVLNGADDTLLPGGHAKDGAGKDTNSEEGGTPGADGSNTNASSGKDSKDGGAAVKANKGMILRKSVEYIRYLQQLVSAQAARNRALEARLARAGINPVPGEGESEGVAMGMSPSENNGAEGRDGENHQHNGINHGHLNHHSYGADVLGLHAFDIGALGGCGFGALEPMAEGSEGGMDMDMDMDGLDFDGTGSHSHSRAMTNGHVNGHANGQTNGVGKHARCRSASGAAVGTSPSASAASEDADDGDDGTESNSNDGGCGSSDGGGEERGRRGRDGRVPRVPRGGLVAVKEEGAGMEV